MARGCRPKQLRTQLASSNRSLEGVEYRSQLAWVPEGDGLPIDDELLAVRPRRREGYAIIAIPADPPATWLIGFLLIERQAGVPKLVDLHSYVREQRCGTDLPLLASHFLPKSFSRSAFDSFTQVGRP
jgi:hypothetical protein